MKRINPETGEEEEGHWLFGRWVSGMKVNTKGKGKAKSAPRRSRNTAPEPPPPVDTPPDGLDLPSRPSLARDIGQAVSGYNTLLLMLPWTAGDALTQSEAERLVYGLDEAQKANARIRKYVKVGSQGAGVFALVIAAAGILLDRAAKHGWLPGLRKPTPEEYAWAKQQQEAAYQAMMGAAQAQGSVPPDPNQPPTVPPIYSNGGTPQQTPVG